MPNSIWQVFRMVRTFRCDDSFSFLNRIKPVRREIWQCFNGAIRPEDFGFIQRCVIAQSEMNAQIVLREITSSAS